MASKPEPQTLTIEKTCWIFLTCSLEKRHVEDMVLGVDCLKTIGVPGKNIFIFSDQPERQVLLDLYGIEGNIFELPEFSSEVQKITGFDHVVLIIGGHGSQEGLIGQHFKMPPQQIIEALRTIPQIKAGVVVAGQCYAGVFNYLSVGDTDPQFVILGATNLNPSLSDKAELDAPIKSKNGTSDLESWSANIFLLHFFIWLKRPVDVDGDEKKSILDAYKYAGVESNKRLRASKSALHYGIEVLKSQQMERLMDAPPQDREKPLPYIKHMLDVGAAQRKITQQLDMLYLHQESWILHSQFARVFTIAW